MVELMLVSEFNAYKEFPEFTAPRNCEVFSGFSTEVLRACLQDGVTKIEGLISGQDVQSLLAIERMSILTLDPLSPDSKNFPVVAALYDSIGKHTSTFRPDFVFVERRDSPMHIDATILEGVSLLVPIDGPKAIFYFDDKPFTNNKDAHGRIEYGPGDVLLLRQGIRNINGFRLQTPLKRVYHAAESTDQRRMLTIDFKTDSWIV